MARQHWNFDNRVDCGQVHDHQHGRYLDEIGWGDEPRDLGVDDAKSELADDIKDACGDHLVERILNKGLEPSPKEPVELGNDKEWNKDGAKEDANRRSITPNATTISARPSVTTAANHSNA